jgi:hypothetical protein
MFYGSDTHCAVSKKVILAFFSDACFVIGDDTSIFSRPAGLLKTKDQPSITVYENIEFNKHHMKSPVVTPG